jgi:hypothetical protein
MTPGGSALLSLTASDLETHGIKGLMIRHQTSADVLVPALMQSGVLPRQIRRYEPLVIRLVDLNGFSHSAAARNLRVTRWTVAAWRKRLGLDERGGCAVGSRPEKGIAAS